MKSFFAAILLASLSVLCARAQSPYESSADFAKYAMKLREQALLKVEPQVFVPTTSRNTVSRFPWKTNIVTTVFWVGEAAVRQQSSPERQKFVGRELDLQLRRLR